jgi:hypothetical protein
VKLGPGSGHAVVVRRFLPAFGLVCLLACDPRPTVVGAVALTGDDGGFDAGTLGRAEPVGPLAMARCVAKVFPRLPFVTCQGASSPPEFQCVVAVQPDGGVSVLRQLPFSETRSVTRLHGVGAGLVVSEVVDSAPGPRALEAFPLSVVGPVTALDSLPASSRLSGVSVSSASLDVVACESGNTCRLREVRLDGGGGTDLSGDVRSASTGAVVRLPGGGRAWSDDGGVVTWRPGEGLARIDAPGISHFAVSSDSSLFLLRDATLERVTNGVRAVLAEQLDAPRALFALGGFAVVVEPRAIRAFPRAGGAPLILYELSASSPGTLGNARLVDGRLVFDQVCATGPRPTTGRVELDPTLARARWLNEDPAWPFMPGAAGGASPVADSLRDVLTVEGLLVGVVE